LRLGAEIPSAAATQAQPEAPATDTTTAEQTRPAPAAPPPGDRPGRVSRDDRHGRRGGLLAVLALLAVLLVIGALAAPGLLGGSGDQNPGSNGAGQNNAQGGGNGGGSNGGGSGEKQSSGGDQQAAASSGSPSTSASAGESAPSQDNSGQGGLTAQDAEQTVEEFYTSTSEGHYDKAAQLLSESYRQSTFPDRATYERTFDKVESVVFIKGPSAEVSGDTATVSGETRATLNSRIEHNKGVWKLVQEGGEWKIDGWSVTNLSTRPT
jgi:hypothetical protein